MDEPTRRRLSSFFDKEHILPRPDPATYAEALLAVLRLGYVVVIDGETSDPTEDSFAGALAQIRELGWPLQEIELYDQERRARGELAYTLKAPFVPGWTWAAEIPVIKMEVA